MDMNREMDAVARLGSIFAHHDVNRMSLTSLCHVSKSNWSNFNCDLSLKQWLTNSETARNYFMIDDSRGPGNDEVISRNSVPPVLACSTTLPPLFEDICRPFDAQDVFAHELNPDARTSMWNEFLMKQGIDDNDANRLLFNRAYVKCARLTIRISNVVRSREYTNQHLKQALSEILVADSSAKVFLYKDNKENGAIYCPTNATLYCPGTSGARTQAALSRIVYFLNSGKVRGYGGITLRLFSIGWYPLMNAVITCFDDLTNETNPSPRGVPPIPPATTSSPRLPRAVSMFPEEYTFTYMFDPVLDAATYPDIREGNDRIKRQENALRSACNNETKTEEEMECYINRNHVKYFCMDEYLIGSGAEASIYFGLYHKQDLDEEILVAVKHSSQGRRIFNAKEDEHAKYLIRADVPGVVKYYTTFVFMRADILVQEVGCCTLRQLIDKDNQRQVKCLSAKDRFLLSKALCMAVSGLHGLDPCIIHRDLRPENVLIMRDGSLRLTDFGLARQHSERLRGTSLYTRNILTSMQPYEVQKRFPNNQDHERQKLPVSKAADIFMLGCVLAFINTGRLPFRTDTDILNVALPELGDLQDTKPWLFHLLSSMLSHEASSRPSIEHVLKHPYYASYPQNFHTLINNIENVVVCDRSPHDSPIFRVREEVLSEVEKQYANEPQWHTLLPRDLVSAYTTFQINFVDSSRPYPLPVVGPLLRFIRNMVTHLHSDVSLQERLRSCHDGANLSDPSTCYTYPGEFFTRHPAVCNFLLRVWDVSVQQHRRICNKMRDLSARYEADMDALTEKADTFLGIFASA